MNANSFLLFAILTNNVLSICQAYTDPHFVGDRTVIVQLFEWKWYDVAAECVRYLGPKNYGAVQVSPPNEHSLTHLKPPLVASQKDSL